MTIKALQPSKVRLITFDPDSPEHVQRLYNQRIACGWSAKDVEKFRDWHREGKKGIHWIALSPNHPNYQSLISQHLSKYPGESKPLSDTSVQLFGKARQRSLAADILDGNSGGSDSLEFIPIGHISLDSTSIHPYYADTPPQTYAITQFYISWALQSSGLGSLSMTAVEEMAAKTLGAKALVLSTPAREVHFDERLWEGLVLERQKVCTQDWYAKRGYGVYKYVDDYLMVERREGGERGLRFVFMLKELMGIGEGNGDVDLREEIPVVPTPTLD